jgi:hypothetical protein
MLPYLIPCESVSGNWKNKTSREPVQIITEIANIYKQRQGFESRTSKPALPVA